MVRLLTNVVGTGCRRSDERLWEAGRQHLRLLRSLRKVCLVGVVAIAGLEIDGLALPLTKLREKRIQAVALSGAIRVSRHG
jgi:hypothetical protein